MKSHILTSECPRRVYKSSNLRSRGQFSLIFMGKMLFSFGVDEKSFKNIRKKSILLIKSNISYIYSKKFLKIFLELILTNTMRQSYEKNYSPALRKLTASEIGSVCLHIIYIENKWFSESVCLCVCVRKCVSE